MASQPDHGPHTAESINSLSPTDSDFNIINYPNSSMEFLIPSASNINSDLPDENSTSSTASDLDAISSHSSSEFLFPFAGEDALDYSSFDEYSISPTVSEPDTNSSHSGSGFSFPFADDNMDSLDENILSLSASNPNLMSSPPNSEFVVPFAPGGNNDPEAIYESETPRFVFERYRYVPCTPGFRTGEHPAVFSAMAAKPFCDDSALNLAEVQHRRWFIGHDGEWLSKHEDQVTAQVEQLQTYLMTAPFRASLPYEYSSNVFILLEGYGKMRTESRELCAIIKEKETEFRKLLEEARAYFALTAQMVLEQQDTIRRLERFIARESGLGPRILARINPGADRALEEQKIKAHFGQVRDRFFPGEGYDFIREARRELVRREKARAEEEAREEAGAATQW